MVSRKRTTTKTGKFSKSTRTLSSTGRVTQSFSSKPPGSPTRRTVSFSGGKMRTTYSTKQGGDWTKVTTKTQTLVSKPKKIKVPSFRWGSSSRSKTKENEEIDYGEGGEFSWFWFLLGLIVYPFLLPFKLLGVWGGWFIYIGLYFYFFEF
jgi:hypothetical protein